MFLMTHAVQMTMNDAKQMTNKVLDIVGFILFQCQLNKYHLYFITSTNIFPIFL